MFLLLNYAVIWMECGCCRELIRGGGWTSLSSHHSRQNQWQGSLEWVSHSCEPLGQEYTFKVVYLLFKGPERDLEGLKILACSLMPTGSSPSVLDHWLHCKWSQEQRPFHPLSAVALWPEIDFLWLLIFRENIKIFKHFIILHFITVYMNTGRPTLWKRMRTNYKYWKSFSFKELQKKIIL